VLDRDLDVAEADLLEDAHLEQGRLDQRLGGGAGVPGQDLLLERAGVDPDPDGDAAGLRLLGDQLHLVVLLDVAGVDPDPGAAGLDGGHGVLPLEVDVGHHRDGRLGRDRGQGGGVVGVGHGHPHDVAAGGGQLGDLLQGAVDVGGLGDGHGLDADGGAAADGDPADVDPA
jgi:hypothetical protein